MKARRRPAQTRLLVRPLLGLLVGLALLGGCGDPGIRPAPGPAPAPDTAATPGAEIRLELLADANLPYGSISPVGPAAAEFGGISGLAWQAGTRELLAVTDDRDRLRIFRIGLIVEAGSGKTTLQADVHGVQELEPAAASGEPPRLYDLEAIALSDDDRLFVATEGRVETLPRIAPAVAEYTPAGELTRILPLPEGFAAAPSGPPERGVRDNLGFESLTLSPAGDRLIAAPESALVQDGPVADLGRGTSVRLVTWSLAGGEPRPAAQYVYPLDPVTDPGFPAGLRVNGLAELLDLGDDRLLALERAFVQRRGSAGGRNVVRIYSVSLAGATDVSDRVSLTEGPAPEPARKRLVLDLDDIVDKLDPRFPGLDNFEGMALGPELPDGSPTLILVSDDNFNPAQRTVFLLFRIVEGR